MLARFFSPGVVAELQDDRTNLTLARRHALVMFVDLRSFTLLSEASEPEAIAEVLSEYRQLVTEAVFEHGGTVDKFIGDGVMAVFGHPRTGEDDAARAIACGLRLTTLLAQWSHERVRHGKTAVEAGIGLHAGPVVGGVLESGRHAEFTVFGDAVNVAERLERLCRSLNAVLVISEDVLDDAPHYRSSVDWIWKEAAEINGRRGKLRLAYLSRLHAPSQ